METAKHAVHAAEERVGGHDRKNEREEPVSGVRGSGTATEPYDAGNATDQPGNPVEGHSEESTARLARDSVNCPDATTNGAHTSERHEQDPNAAQMNDSLDRPTRSPPDDALDTEGVPGKSETLACDDEEEPPSDPAWKDRPDSASSESTSIQQSQSKDSERSHASHEKHRKSTGFAAQGGNFDAKAPGAGREAGRLRDEQGEPVQAPSRSGEMEETPKHHGGIWQGTHKSGITMEKAKDKLHIGKHHS